jgi:DNA-binding FadR family transcriptional regulator
MTAHTIIFSPIEQATRAEQVVERLENAIISGLLKHHEQLPNESDLARLMGVSPITVRDALNTLRGKGLIDTRRGRNGGSFVCELSLQQIFRQHPLHQASHEYIADLGELHSAILGHAAALAAQRSTPEDLQKFEQLICTFAQASQPDVRVQSDMRCLLTLCALAQSARLTSQELSLQAEWAPLMSILYQDAPFHQQLVQHYHTLLASLAQGDAVHAQLHSKNILIIATDRMLSYKFALQEC